ncbi:MAG: hypothetical protein P8R42_02770 [Candidatus Binatia bacterium]|nr:hypothetical protein [Candidatus Binatia bacterium]
MGYSLFVALAGVDGLGASPSREGHIDLVLPGHPERAEALASELSDAALMTKSILPAELCRQVRRPRGTSRD